MLHSEEVYRIMNERPPSTAPVIASFVLAALFLLAAAVVYTIGTLDPASFNCFSEARTGEQIRRCL
jgi:hypothetical protein